MIQIDRYSVYSTVKSLTGYLLRGEVIGRVRKGGSHEETGSRI